MKINKLLLTVSITVFMVVMVSTISYGASHSGVRISSVSPSAAIVDPDPMDIGPNIELELDLSNVSDFSGLTCKNDYDLDDQVIALGINWYYGFAYIKTYTVRAIGTHGEVWIADDLGWLPGDTRSYPVITDAQIDYILNEFDTSIYTRDTEFFGVPDHLDGTNATFDDILRDLGESVPDDYYCNPDKKDRVIIMVDNVIDDNYYNPTFPVYIAGVYASAYDIYFDRNVITIDAYEWEKRMGPPGPEITRPYLYESAVAHEFQHLIHSDIDPGEEVFVQEGCSVFAQWICGYGHSTRHIDFFVDHPENSLTAWGDQGTIEILADYGICYLWMLYLYEHFGGAPFIQALVAHQGIGIDGINAVLDDFGFRADFEDVFHTFRIALLIDSPQPCRLPFISPKIHSPRDICKLPHPYEFTNIDIHVNIDTEEARGLTYISPEGTCMNFAPPWGTDYIKIEDPDHLQVLAFDGSDFLPTPWISNGDALWSGAGDLLDNFMIAKVDLTGSSGSTLKFDTWYETEYAWDYGFVQVSTDGGQTWISLSNSDTTDVLAPGAHPTVVANVPGFTGKSGIGINPWTGLPYDDPAIWVTESFDLSAYDGQNILLAFRYVTDWVGIYPGWLVDNIRINESVVSDGSSTAGFISIQEVLDMDNDFTITLVGINERHGKTQYTMKEVWIRDLDEVGYAFIDGIIKKGGYGAILISFNAPKNTGMYAGYEYSLFDFFKGPWRD